MDEKSHWLHLCGLSPVWIIVCLFKLIRCTDEKLHWLHSLGFSPVCVLMCFFKLPFKAVEYLHWLHLWYCIIIAVEADISFTTLLKTLSLKFCSIADEADDWFSIKSFHLCWQFQTEANPVWAPLMDKPRIRQKWKCKKKHMCFALKTDVWQIYLLCSQTISNIFMSSFLHRRLSFLPTGTIMFFTSQWPPNHPYEKHNFTGKSSFTFLWPAPSSPAQWTSSMQFSLRSGTGVMNLETRL